MSSVVISGDTSGAITLAAPAVSGTNTATLPATTGTVAVADSGGRIAPSSSSNTGLGYQVLNSNTAVNNTAIGYQALFTNTGAYNTAIGYQAGKSNTTGTLNATFGHQGGFSLTTGSQNAFFGGVDSGYYVSTGSKNSILGSYNGNQGGLDIRTASNYIVLSDGDGNPRGFFDNLGYFHVASTSSTLYANSSNSAADSGFAYANGYLQACGYNGNAMLINRTGSDGSIATWYRSGTAVGSIAVTTALTTYNTTSDYRLKTVIGSVLDSGQRIDALEPIEYDWKAGGRTRGFLAHKFAEVYPTSVSGEKDAVDEEGKPVYQGMQASTSEVMADLIAEIQSLRKRVALLESK